MQNIGRKAGIYCTGGFTGALTGDAAGGPGPDALKKAREPAGL
jgi:hypothetical protein